MPSFPVYQKDEKEKPEYSESYRTSYLGNGNHDFTEWAIPKQSYMYMYPDIPLGNEFRIKNIFQHLGK